jgi:hypothetical protein
MESKETCLTYRDQGTNWLHTQGWWYRTRQLSLRPARGEVEVGGAIEGGRYSSRPILGQTATVWGTEEQEMGSFMDRLRPNVSALHQIQGFSVLVLDRSE